MKSFFAVIVLLGCVGCSTSAATKAADDSDGKAVLFITRPDGQNDTIWSRDRGHLRVEAGCILFKGQLEVFPLDTIPEITRTRLAKAAQAVHGDDAPGLRCYRLGSSNFTSWDALTAPNDANGLSEQLSLLSDNLDDDASSASIVAEVMIKEGIPLHADWRWETIAGDRAVVIGDKTVVCLHNQVTAKVVDAVERLGVERCVMLESSFAGNDEAKSNAFYRFRDAKIAFRTL